MIFSLRLFFWWIGLSLQGEYYNCPSQIFLKLSGLQDSGMEKCSSFKLAAEIHFYYLKNSVRFWTKNIFLGMNSNQ